jgi:ceramide glucosyltransferase
VAARAVALVIVVTCAVAYLLLLALKSMGVAWSVHRQRTQAQALPALATDWMQSVTVLQPILSGDAQLDAVLRDTVRALPDATFLWLIDEDDAVAQTTASDIQRTQLSTAIHVRQFNAAPPGVNPKMYKVAAALGDVTTPITLVLDDDARLSQHSLRQLVAELATADLVTALPFYRDASMALSERLLAQFVNNNAALTYLAMLPLMAPVSINGMCYAMRTDFARADDALSPVLPQLADDLALAQLFRSRGARIRQSTAPVEMETATPTLARYRQQMHRWFLFATLLVQQQTLRTQLLIATLYALPPLLLAAVLVGAPLSADTRIWGVAVAVLVCRALALTMIQRNLTGQSRHRVVLSVASELLQPLHLLHALLNRTIIWRTRRYRVRDNHDFRALEVE